MDTFLQKSELFAKKSKYILTAAARVFAVRDFNRLRRRFSVGDVPLLFLCADFCVFARQILQFIA